jgi:hypothetical protein
VSELVVDHLHDLVAVLWVNACDYFVPVWIQLAQVVEHQRNQVREFQRLFNNIFLSKSWCDAISNLLAHFFTFQIRIDGGVLLWVKILAWRIDLTWIIVTIVIADDLAS